MQKYWKIPKIWTDETVFVVGGGPSLEGFDYTGIDKFKVIGVNNAFYKLPLDFLFYADTRWWRWYGPDIPLDYPARIVSTCSAAAHTLDPRVLRVGRDYGFTNGGNPLSFRSDHLAGPDGGYMAINLAVLLGASRIILLGFDMGFDNGKAHHHADHPIPSRESDYTDLFAPRYPRLVEELKRNDIEILRCTPSRLDFIPEIPFAEALQLPQRRRRIS